MPFRLTRLPLAIAAAVLLAAAGALAVQAPAPANQPVLGACTLGGQAAPASVVLECGWYPVAEDPGNPAGRWLRLRVVQLRAASRSPAGADGNADEGSNSADNAVVRLVGGPGQGAASLAGGLIREHQARFPTRDLVLVDQRGTGESNGLFCASDHALTAPVAELVRDVFPSAPLHECRAALASRADLSKYVTDFAADDLAHVLSWLGYSRVTLVGGSYGTRMAQVFMRRHPDRVRAAVLDGVIPMDGRSPSTYSATATAAMHDLVDACLADPACRQAFPDLRQDTDDLWSRLADGPVDVEVTDRRSGRRVRVDVPKHIFGYAIRGILYEPRQFVGLPRLLHAASGGDYRALVDAYIQRKIDFSGGDFATGMYFSVFCSEDVPFIPEDAAQDAGGVMGAALVRDFRSVCDGWPRAALPAGWHDRVETDHPVLLLSGEFDPVTPSAMGAAVASGFPNGLHVVVPGAGHGSNSNPEAAPCTQQIITDFVRAGSTSGLDVSCLARVGRMAFRR